MRLGPNESGVAGGQEVTEIRALIVQCDCHSTDVDRDRIVLWRSAHESSREMRRPRFFPGPKALRDLSARLFKQSFLASNRAMHCSKMESALGDHSRFPR